MKRTRHHVPPRNPDRRPRKQIIWKEERHHQAYHLLFGAPRTFQEAVAILKRDWFPFDEEEPCTSATSAVNSVSYQLTDAHASATES
jgi:hypothetical protein